VNFQSFNAYNAGVLEVTTFSFQVNLGIFPRCLVTPEANVKVRDGRLCPEEYICDFRRMMPKRLAQPEAKEATMFYVAPDGSNLDEVVADAHRAITTDGLRWFARLDGLDALLDELREAPMDMKDGTWGMGHFGSPHRRELTAALEAAIASR
jgi:hypothetical protein